MCIVFYTLSQPGYQLILISNRDEYLDRPAVPAGWHNFEALDSSSPPPSDDPSRAGWVLSGRDAASTNGGTWLGMTKGLRIGVLTNIRTPVKKGVPSTPSRGMLLKDFLQLAPTGDLPSVRDYLQSRASQADQYDGFNLLLFQLKKKDAAWLDPEIGYLSNKPEPSFTDIYASTHSQPSSNGIYCQTCGLSNSPLAMPWPKVTQGQARMESTLRDWIQGREDEDALIERLMALLQHSVPAEHGDLSETTRVQPILVPLHNTTENQGAGRGRWYGTRLSTVILVKENGEVTFVERDISSLDEKGDVMDGGGERRFHFRSQDPSAP